MAHIFISYSKKDIDFARHLRHLLQDQGFAVWMDETRLVPSEKWWPTIERNIISCAAFIVIMSPNGKDSEWIEREILVAEDEDHRRPIFPVLLEGKRWGRLANIQHREMMQGVESSLDIDFIEGLRQYASTDGSKAPPPLPEPVIGTGSIPLVTPPNRVRWLFVIVGMALIIAAASIAILSRGSSPTPTAGVPTDNVTETIEAGVKATVDNQTQIALAATATQTASVTLTLSATPSATLTIPPPPSVLPLNAETRIAATFTSEVIETINAIASYTKTPTPTYTASNTASPTPDIDATVKKGVGETRTANAIASYTKTPTPTYTFTASNTPTPTPTFTPTFTDTPSHTPSVTHTPTSTFTPSVTPTPTRDPLAKVMSNAEWKPLMRVETFDGVEMVLVPAGCFQMGSDNGADDEKPVHKVCFDKPYWIDRYEVTNQQYGSVGRFKGANKPRESISWTNADAFCKLREARLPTEAEWEYAARGPDGLIYPWGNEFIADNVVYSENSGGQTAEVGSKAGGISWVGAYDLSGNVWEWVADWYGSYAADEQTKPQGTQSGSSRVLRGGSWSYLTGNVRAAFRFNWSPGFEYDFLGFRCARSLD